MALTNTIALAQRIERRWSNEWVPKTETWTRVWNRDSRHERVEVLRYADEFSSAPRVVACEGGELRFRLEEKPARNTGRIGWCDDSRQTY
jgi:hypothetical protein